MRVISALICVTSWMLLVPLGGCKTRHSEVIELTRSARELNKAKKYDEALQAADAALKIEPDYVDAYLEKGRTMEDQEKLDEAIAYYDQAVKTDPKHIAANLILGNAHRRSGNVEQATFYVETASKLSPGEGYIHHILGQLYFVANRVPDARVQLEKAANLNKDDAEFQLDLGKFYERIDENEKAIAQYNIVLELLKGLPRFKEWTDFATQRIKELSVHK